MLKKANVVPKSRRPIGHLWLTGTWRKFKFLHELMACLGFAFVESRLTEKREGEHSDSSVLGLMCPNLLFNFLLSRNFKISAKEGIRR